MGQLVVCECGQKNDLGVFGFGEKKLCLACGQPLTVAYGSAVSDPFIPEVPEDAFSDDGGVERAVTGFESPSLADDAPAARGTSPASPVAPIWAGGIREVVSGRDGEQCSRCGASLRGDWDRHTSPSGVLCHRCSTQADQHFRAPTLEERRELYRAVPPKAVPVAPAKDTRPEKFRGLVVLGGVGLVVILLAMIFPVEVWIAELFSPDLDRARGLPQAWHWVVRGLNFVASAFGQGVGLYVTLSVMGLLYDDQRQNLVSVTYLGISFAIINVLVSWGTAHFGVFGIAAMILISMAFIVSFMIKLLMISGQFPIRMEGGVAFTIAWFLCSVLLGPCIRMVEWLLGGIVAAIAL